MPRIDVDIDVSDLLWDMDRYEKQEMVEALYDDGYVPTKLKQDLETVAERTAITYTERDLSELLDKIWNNRLFLNDDDIQTLKVLSKKGLYTR